MTRLPTHAQIFLSHYASPFGGVDEVLRLLPDTEIEKILTFPGPIYVVKPWAATVDLQAHGYQPSTAYDLLDNRGQRLGTYFADDGYFGTQSIDQERLFRAEHGSIIYLRFADTILLLWVCNRLAPAQRDRQIQSWLREAERYQQVPLAPELFVRTHRLLPDDELQIIHVPGAWVKRFSLLEMREHPHREVSTHRGRDEIISVLLKTTGWYSFEAIRGASRFLLEIIDLQGVGVNKVRPTTDGVYFITLTSGSTALTPSLAALPSVTGLGGREPYLRLEAIVSFREPELLVEGEALIEANQAVLTELKLETISGTASQRSILSPGGYVEAEGIATVLPFSPDYSEIMIVDGVAVQDLLAQRFVVLPGIFTGVAEAVIDLAEGGYSENEGVAEVEADILVQYFCSVQTVQSLSLDPLNLLLLNGEVMNEIDPLESAWYSVEFRPYTHQAEPIMDTLVKGVATVVADFEVT